VLVKIKYKEEYNDMKKYVYFPYHITPEYEKKSEASKLLNQVMLGSVFSSVVGLSAIQSIYP